MTSLRELRFQARRLYKELHYLGRSYPDPAYNFHQKLHGCFLAHVGIEDEERMKQAIAKAEYIKKEIEMMYYLKKYRSLRKRYPDSNEE